MSFRKVCLVLKRTDWLANLTFNLQFFAQNHHFQFSLTQQIWNQKLFVSFFLIKIMLSGYRHSIYVSLNSSSKRHLTGRGQNLFVFSSRINDGVIAVMVLMNRFFQFARLPAFDHVKGVFPKTCKYILRTL